MPLQIPPAVGSSGQFVETVIVTSSQQRHVMVIGDGVSTAYASVTSSGGLGVTLTNPSAATTAVTVTNISTAVTVTNLVRSLSSGTVTLSSNPTVVLSSPTSLSSGIVTLSSVPTVTATAATNPWSSAPGFNMPMVSASSGLVQISGTPTVVSASSGLVQTLSSGPITGTVNTLSSGPVLVLTSGPMTIAGTVTVLNTSSDIVQAIVTGSSGVGAIVTSSGALLVSGMSPGTVSTAVNLLTTTGGFYLATTSMGQVQSLTYGVGTESFRLRNTTSVGSISTSPGTLYYLNVIATSTGVLVDRFVRLYNLTTNNATSSSNAGLASAVAAFRIHSTVSYDIMVGPFPPQGVRFGTACSYDVVANIASTVLQLGAQVTAVYTSS